MNKTWITKLAEDIEMKYGKEARDRLFGDIDGIQDNPEFLSAWFDNFTSGMNELGDKEFLQQMMVNRCPCGFDSTEAGNAVKNIMEFIESIICGGKECTMTVHLPEKKI